MSQEYAWPGAWSRPSVVQAPAARRARVSLGDAGFALVLGGLPQAFDACVFGVLAATVFPQAYFSRFSPDAGVVAALTVWALAYLVAWQARPIFLDLDRRLDPRLRLGAARFVLMAATLAIATLPVASAAPWSPLLLILARCAQGLGMGGLSHGRLAPQLGEGAERDARLRSWSIAAGLGLAAATVVLGVLILAAPHADFLAWGWRYPFVVALALTLPALFADLQVEAERRARRANGRPALRLVSLAGEPVSRRG